MNKGSTTGSRFADVWVVMSEQLGRWATEQHVDAVFPSAEEAEAHVKEHGGNSYRRQVRRPLSH